MTLDHLHVGQSGIIKTVGGEGVLRRRFLDMGLTPGTRVLIRKMAPLGDPIEIYLRKEDAQRIQIEPVSSKPQKGGSL